MIAGWHFVNNTLRDGSPIPPDGIWLRHNGKCRMCESGLHASRRIIDALRYAPGSTICRVACVDIAEEYTDKLVCHSRLIMWRLEAADELLRTFARKAAISVIHLWDCPPIVKQYLETGDETIRDAAWATARDAAWAAARAAAPDAKMEKFDSQFEAMILAARGNPDDAYLLCRAAKLNEAKDG